MLFYRGDASELGNKQEPGEGMEAEIEYVDRLLQCSAGQHFEFFPDMRFRKKRGEPQGQTPEYGQTKR